MPEDARELLGQASWSEVTTAAANDETAAPEREATATPAAILATAIASDDASASDTDEPATDTNNSAAAAAKPSLLAAYPDTRSNLLTLLLAIAIIATGYLLPTFLGPMMDKNHGETLVLKDPSLDTEAAHIFPEPISLYPWNLYQPDNCRGLVPSERLLLLDRKIPDFLLASLLDRGLTVPTGEGGVADTSPLREAILDGFTYLYVEDESYPDCFVLVNADIDGDGEPDISCAVEQDGTIVSLLFLSPRWDTVTLTAEDYPPSSEENAAGEVPADADAAVDGDTSAEGADAGAGDAGADEDAASAEGDGADGTDGTGGEGAGADGGTGQPPALGPANLEYLPMDEDRQLWSFAYATTHEANTYQQPELAMVFGLLDENFQYRYGYTYRLYLLFQNGGNAKAGGIANDAAGDAGAGDAGDGGDGGTGAGAGAAGDEQASGQAAAEIPSFFPLNPTVFATTENLLYIYDLPQGVRIILYLDPVTKHCVGFNQLTP